MVWQTENKVSTPYSGKMVCAKVGAIDIRSIPRVLEITGCTTSFRESMLRLRLDGIDLDRFNISAT